MLEGNISNTNPLGSFKAEKKRDVREKCLIRIETKDPAIALVTSSRGVARIFQRGGGGYAVSK